MDLDLSRLDFHFHNGPSASGEGPVKVGWFLHGSGPEVLFAPPTRVVSRELNRTHAKSASRCPAVLNMETRYFQVSCPYDLAIGLRRGEDGKLQMVNRAGTASPIRGSKIGQMMTLVSEAEWRYPDRPTVQLKLPYVFVADEPVWMTQLDAFMHYRKTSLPGTIFGGRFPIHNWPRQIMWAFEWHDITADLVLRRGEPLFYVQFEAHGADRPVQMLEADKTPELLGFMEAIGGAVNYVNQTFSLFKEAERIRPSRLVEPKRRS